MSSHDDISIQELFMCQDATAVQAFQQDRIVVIFQIVSQLFTIAGTHYIRQGVKNLGSKLKRATLPVTYYCSVSCVIVVENIKRLKFLSVCDYTTIVEYCKGIFVGYLEKGKIPIAASSSSVTGLFAL